jgi:hypothetical protein
MMYAKRKLKKIVCGTLICGLLVVMAGCGANKAAVSKNAVKSGTSTTSTSGSKTSSLAKTAPKAVNERSTQGIEKQLAQLVKDGTITRTQSAAVLTTLTEKRATRQSGQKAGQQVAPGQKKPTSRLQTLIDNGTITQSQADAIMKALQSKLGSRSQGNSPQPAEKPAGSQS